jgi:peptidoglycan/LPS O-acetylase OafA/YrhL
MVAFGRRRLAPMAAFATTDPALPYRSDIDGLRALAVISTLWFHFFPTYLPGGFIGVDIFFVISGYLITGVIITDLTLGTFSLRGFYARRIKRILPALCLLLTTVGALGWMVLLGNEYEKVGKHLLAAGAFASNILLLFETSYFNPISETMPLLHLWSLGVEEQFYIVWPLIVALLWRSRGTLFATTLVIALSSFVFNLQTTPLDGVFAFYSPFTRVWELMIGALIALGHRSFPSSHVTRPADLVSPSGALFIIGCALLVIGFLCVGPLDPFPGWRALIPTCGAGCIIAARSPSRLQSLALSNRLMVGIGLISYPLYLWHWPLLSYATILSSGDPSGEVLWILIGATIALSLLTYFCFERPIKRGARHRWKVIVPLLALVTITSFGGSVYLSNGYPQRTAALPISSQGLAAPYASSCARLTGEPDYRDDWCNPHIPYDHPKILLLGDSFSAPYSAMLVELGKTHPVPFQQFARGQCTSLLGYGPPQCRELLDKILSQDFVKDITTVVIALDWRSYLYGKHYILMENAQDDTAMSFTTALQTTLDYWKRLGKRIVIFYSPPQGMNLDACIARRFSLSDPESCRYTREQAERRDAEYRTKLAEIMGNRPNITYFDPFPFLCDGKNCMVTHRGDFMYRDTVKSETEPPFIWNHLSQYGAEFLAHASRAELIRILDSRQN